MDIVLSANNGEEEKVLPIVPSDINIEETMKNESFETINGGEIILIGNIGLRRLNIDSIFPNQKYTWIKKGASHDGWSYIKFIKKWKEKRMPIRLVITSKDGEEVINIAAAIDSLSYSLDSVGDIAYSLGLIEYRFIDVR